MNNSDLNENTSLQSADDASEWLAMQYVLGELSAEQVERFESAMAGNVALCELVLTATKLSAGIAMAFESQQSKASPVSVRFETVLAEKTVSPVLRERQVFARLSVFLATSAMGLAVLTMMTLDHSRTSTIVLHDDAVADAFAMLLGSSPSNDLNSEFDEFVESEDPISSLVAPEWLLTAVDLDAAAELDDPQADNPEDESRIF